VKQSTAEVVAHINSTHGTSYQLVRRLAGGLQSGAFELSDGSSKAVLKWSENPGWAHRVFRAAELVQKARAAGYPTPAWLAVGTTVAGSPYQLQEYVDGTPLIDATSLDLDLAEQLVLISECQRGLVDDGQSNWSDYVRGVVFEGWDGTWEEVRALDARSAELIERFQRVCDPCRDQELPVDDFVHGDLNVSNLVVADGVIAAVIDIEAASGGTRAYDLVALAASAARDGAPAGVDEFFFEAALQAGGRAAVAISAAADFAGIAAFVSGIGSSPVSRVQLGAERLLRLLEA
jgi:aminoglycoside phosphotransferase (APT) family kinase protein